jgi:hypothetical protein
MELPNVKKQTKASNAFIIAVDTIACARTVLSIIKHLVFAMTVK